MLFCWVAVVARERSGLCHLKLESSHCARLTWRINTDVSHSVYQHYGAVLEYFHSNWVLYETTVLKCFEYFSSKILRRKLNLTVALLGS